MSEEVRKTYEISFLSESEDGVAALTGHIKSAGGEIINEGNIKNIELAYPINKKNSAYFGCVYCSLPNDSIEDLSKTLNLEGAIMRFIIVTPPFRNERRDQVQRPIVPLSPKRPVQIKTTPQQSRPESTAVSNELLEEKLEEILK